MSGFAQVLLFSFKAFAEVTGDIRSSRAEENNNFLTRGMIRTMTFRSWNRSHDAIFTRRHGPQMKKASP
jgi:hypothetical protein